MNEDVAEAGEVGPGELGIRGLERIAQSLDRLAHDLEIPDRRVLEPNRAAPCSTSLRSRASGARCERRVPGLRGDIARLAAALGKTR